jgi:hypothetical protein
VARFSLCWPRGNISRDYNYRVPHVSHLRRRRFIGGNHRNQAKGAAVQTDTARSSVRSGRRFAARSSSKGCRTAKWDLFEGFIEGCGRQDAAECLIFYGWASRQCMSLDEWAVTVVFQRGSVSARAQVAFHDRPDVGTRGVGFVALLPTHQVRLGNLLRFELGQYHLMVAHNMADNINDLSDRSVINHAASILTTSFVRPNIPLMSTLLARRFVGEGYIDAYGYHQPSAGWLVIGWISNDWISAVSRPVEVVAHFDSGRCTGAAVFNFLDRPDLDGAGMGVILHLSSPEDMPGQLLKLLSACLRIVMGEQVDASEGLPC